MNRIFMLLLAMLPVSPLKAQAVYQPVKELAAREVPWLLPYLQFEAIHREDGKDVFILSSQNGKLKIAASDVNAAAKGLGWYLKNYCHRSMSHLGDNLAPVLPVPLIKAPVKIVSAMPVRYTLNYCTLSYTMSFYNWKDWQHEIDWMALNGVNLMLATVGAEAVWQQTLKRIGYTDKEIFDFIPGPAYTAWWLMGNLQGWGGPVTRGMINRQADLEKKILARMRALGINPVLQGFYGMVPTSIKSRGVRTMEQGTWGWFERPAYISAGDSSFGKIAGIYYQEMKKLYGSDIRYFAGDPFHEGGNTEGINVAEYGKEIQQEMQRYFPNSTWMLQGWQNNPSPGLLSKLDKSNVLVEELFGENTENWLKRKGYEGTPFIWCTVTNFGEKSGLYGKLQRFADEVNKAENSGYASFMKGTGIMPEGIHNNPVVYSLVLDLAWHKEKVDATHWIKAFVTARYGKDNAAVQTAWQGFVKTVYRNFDAYQEGPSESVFCARPALQIKSASSWGTRARNYDVKEFEGAVKLFVTASQGMKNSPAYQADKIDFVRQALSNKGETAYQDMITAFQNKDLALFRQRSALFLNMILQQDSLLSGNKNFELANWLNAAYNFGKTPYEKKLALKNAKMQITYWGPDDSATMVHDYANKEWSGMMRHFYFPRWKMFVDYCTGRLKGEDPAAPDYFKFEQTWAAKPDRYAPLQLPAAVRAGLVDRILSE